MCICVSVCVCILLLLLLLLCVAHFTNCCKLKVGPSETYIFFFTFIFQLQPNQHSSSARAGMYSCIMCVGVRVCICDCLPNDKVHLRNLWVKVKQSQSPGQHCGRQLLASSNYNLRMWNWLSGCMCVYVCMIDEVSCI